MSAISRGCFSLLIGLLLAGCSLPLLTMSRSQETKLFAKGLDQYLVSGDLTALNQLSKQYPQGEWRAKAEGIIDIAKQRHRQQALVEKKNQELASLQDKNELVRCQQEKVALRQDNQLLEKTLKRLKEVLIDTELQAK